MAADRAWHWVDGIERRLIDRAAYCAPYPLSARLREEWLADLAEQDGRLSRMRFAFGCCWATRVIAREHEAEVTVPEAAVPVARFCVGHAHFIRYPKDDFKLFTRPTTTFVMIALLHAGLLCSVAIGLGPKFSQLITGPQPVQVVEPLPKGF